MVELHRVLPQDWEMWREVRLRALADAPDAFGSTLADWQGANDLERRWRERLGAVPLNLVAVSSGVTVAQASGTGLDESGVSELISMWIAPDERGRGVGDSLVAAIAEWARDQGGTTLSLWVKSMNVEAIALYERNGFVLTLDEEVDGERFMVREL
jgi:GNAT superfamily N-acetyltransferase